MNDQRLYPKKPRQPNRDENIRRMFNDKIATLDELANINGLTKVRIHQIVHGRVPNRKGELTDQAREVVNIVGPAGSRLVGYLIPGPLGLEDLPDSLVALLRESDANPRSKGGGR